MESTNNKGITLIALVITIIVMLILVAVTINMAIDGGLFSYAGIATKKTTEAKNEEEKTANGVYGGRTIEQWVNNPNVPVKNEYGFYYETPYSVLLSENAKGSVVFKENNKIEYYINGVPSDFQFWDTQIVPGNNKITINSVDCNCSQEGTVITMPGVLMSAMTNGRITQDIDLTTTFEEYHDLYCNTIYYSTVNYVDMEGCLFEKNGNFNFANGWYHREPIIYNFDNWKYEITTSHLKDIKKEDKKVITIAVSMDGRDVYKVTGNLEVVLITSMNLEYPWLAPWNDNRQGILDGEPVDGDRVIYEKYYYAYSEVEHGYYAYLCDSSQTFNSSEVLSNIYGVPVVNKN